MTSTPLRWKVLNWLTIFASPVAGATFSGVAMFMNAVSSNDFSFQYNSELRQFELYSENASQIDGRTHGRWELMLLLMPLLCWIALLELLDLMSFTPEVALVIVLACSAVVIQCLLWFETSSLELYDTDVDGAAWRIVDHEKATEAA